MAIGTVEFDLSMVNPETGRFLTARAYTVEGIKNPDGSLRELSIGQLVMALCLKRAYDMENGYDTVNANTGATIHVNGIIELMQKMNATSVELQALTEIETEVVKWPDELYAAGRDFRSLSAYNVSASTETYGGMTYKQVLQNLGVIGSGISYIRVNGDPDSDDIMYDEFISNIESKMDEKNSFSQKTMIELQSLTNKRDQAYDMISNILKSLNTVLVGISNNM